MLLVDAMLYLLAGSCLVRMVYPALMRNQDWVKRPVYAQAIALIVAISFWPLILVAAYYHARIRKD